MIFYNTPRVVGSAHREKRGIPATGLGRGIASADAITGRRRTSLSDITDGVQEYRG
jgi:hypothetical protein